MQSLIHAQGLPTDLAWDPVMTAGRQAANAQHIHPHIAMQLTQPQVIFSRQDCNVAVPHQVYNSKNLTATSACPYERTDLAADFDTDREQRTERLTWI